MHAYLFKRLLATIPTLLGITLITFLLIRIAPGDPVASRFETGEAGGPGSDGGGDADRLADTVRAKKLLLGMVRHDYQVLRFDGLSAAPTGSDAEVQPLDEPAGLGEFEGWVRALALSADGARIVAGGRDQHVRLITVADGIEAERWTGHPAAIRSVAISADGQRIASADDAGNIRLWAPGKAEAVAEIAGDGRPVHDMAFVGEHLVGGSGVGWIKAWKAADGAEVRAFEGHIGAVYAIAPAVGEPAGFWSGGVDRTLRRWSFDAREPIATDAQHGAAITDIVLAADGRALTASDDRQVRLFTPTEGPQPFGEPQIFEGHYKGVRAVAFGANGRVWSAGADETVRQWDAANGRQLAESPYNPGPVHRLAGLPGGGVLVAGDTWAEVPLLSQYAGWLARTAVFDFGRSFVDDEPVMRLIGRALPITLGLNILAIGIIYLVSIPLGIMAAVKRAGWFDNISSVVLFLLYSIPNFWLATLLIMFFSSERNLNILPATGLHSPEEWSMSYFPWLWDRIWHLILPVTVMVYAGFASLSRYMRTSMLEVLGRDYIRTARAKGLPERVVVLKHAFRNALVTIVTLIANLLPRMFGGSLIVEVIFSINGMGKLAFDSILSRDYPVIMAITTLSAVLTLLGILISDLLYGAVDPRVRVEQ